MSDPRVIATGRAICGAPAASDRYVRELDGMRAVAVSLVVSAHYELVPFTPGGFGVTLFFFLSGYLITTLFFAEFRRSATIDVRLFYARRWLRLTPSLLVFVVLAAATYPVSRTSVGGVPAPASQIAAALFYVTNYYILWKSSAFAATVPLGITWSLAVEEHFYLLWPWLLRRVIGDPRRLCATIAALCACFLIWRCIVRFGLHAPTDYSYMASDCRIDSILYGALLRAVFETQSASLVTRLFSTRICRFAAAAALLATFVIRNDDFRETIRYTIQGLALMPVFALVLAGNPDGLIRRCLASRPMVLIGKLSYSIYLFHLLARTPGEVIFGSPFAIGSIVSGLLLTLLIALALHAGVEKPLASLRHRLRRPELSPSDEVPSRRALLPPTPSALPLTTPQHADAAHVERPTLATG